MTLAVGGIWFGLMLNIPVRRFPMGITSILGGKYV